MKLRVLVAAVGVLLLAGCGSVHPGAAAVVDGTEISMTRADDAAEVYCKLALLSTPEGQPVPNADVRRQAVVDLVVGVVSDDLAREAGIDPNPSSYEVSPAQRDELAQSFPDDELDQVIETINASERSLAILEELGGAELGEPNAEAAQKREAGFALLEEELDRRDIEFDPRYGLDGSLQQSAATGSLSVSAEAATERDPQDLPATQQCAA